MGKRWKRPVCWVVGHQWGVMHVGDNLRTTPMGRCLRCGCDQPRPKNAIVANAKQLVEFGERLEAEQKRAIADENEDR